MDRALKATEHRTLYRPPAPAPHPRRLGPIRLIAALKHNPLECWALEHFEIPIVSTTLPLGHVLVVSEPGAIRRVLFDNAANYQKDSLQRRVLAAGLGEGLLGAEGELWRRQRRTLAPLFAKRTVSSFAPAMQAAAKALCDAWQAADGAAIDVATEMSRLTLVVLERTIFSDGLMRDAEEIRAAMALYFNAIGRIGVLDLIGMPALVSRTVRFRARAALRLFESAIDDMIALRRKHQADQPGVAPQDLLALLMSATDPETGQPMSETELRSNILTFISAGHETTANTLTWSLFLVSQSAEWRARLEAEVDRLDISASWSVDDLVETRAVIDEALRLYPAIAAISRVAMGYDVLAGETVRRGTIIVIAPYVLHRHRLIWQEPDVFDPARFLPPARSSIDRYAYLPFGAGPRTCIGSTFALQEATLVLAHIIRNFTLTIAPGHRVTPFLRVTLRPEKGLPMIVRSRRTNG
jgi:cytochrome P450